MTCETFNTLVEKGWHGMTWAEREACFNHTCQCASCFESTRERAEERKARATLDDILEVVVSMGEWEERRRTDAEMGP
jgi:hypothetical protein